MAKWMTIFRILKDLPDFRKKRRVASYGAAAILAAGATIGLPGTAQAASAYNGACGSGYTVIDQQRLESGATVFLTYSSGGYNCVVTVREFTGSAHPMNAWIMRSGDESSSDENPGDFTSYAGPVYTYAKGSCVDWGGSYMYGSTTQRSTHCG